MSQLYNLISSYKTTIKKMQDNTIDIESQIGMHNIIITQYSCMFTTSICRKGPGRDDFAIWHSQRQ